MTDIRVHGERVGPAVTLGLLAAWVLHDAEELATGPRWISENLPALRERFTGVPEPVWGAMAAVEPREFAVAVGVMGTFVASAAVAGHRTGAGPASTRERSTDSACTVWCISPRPPPYAGTRPAPSRRRWLWCRSRCGRGGGCGGPAC